ncbi:MAG: 2Fe-2S ferredoxin-type domain-containing protein [Monoraphidium minutum]|nr:MAG: 2Fe-2S ferredoxin-type domain-containing protein [Monoraphidium minutum]
MALALRAAKASAAARATRPAPAAPRSAVRANFRVTLRAPEGQDTSFECGPDELILDAAEAAGVEMPFMCRSGTCIGCAGRRIEGELMQPDAEERFQQKGFALLCQSYPRSDLVIMSHQEHAWYLADSDAPAKTSSR